MKDKALRDIEVDYEVVKPETTWAEEGPIGPGSKGVHLYKPITADLIEKYLNDMLESKPQRKFKILAGCKTFGTTDLKTRICNDPECGPCSTFNKLFKEEVKKYASSHLSGPDYFLQFIEIDGKPLTEEQKAKFKKQLSLHENRKYPGFFAKRRR